MTKSNSSKSAETAAPARLLDGIRSPADVKALREEVVQSQRRRQFHFEATTQGVIESWDWQPSVDASQRYMRNHIDLDTLEAMARFPAVKR